MDNYIFLKTKYRYIKQIFGGKIKP